MILSEVQADAVYRTIRDLNDLQARVERLDIRGDIVVEQDPVGQIVVTDLAWRRALAAKQAGRSGEQLRLDAHYATVRDDDGVEHYANRDEFAEAYRLDEYT